MHVEGKPGLQSGVHKAPLRVLKVKILMQAFSPPPAQFEPLLLAVRANLIRPAGFDTGEDGDQPFLDIVPASDVTSQIFLTGPAAGEILHRPAGLFGDLLPASPNFIGDFLGVVREVLEEQIHALHETGHAGNVRQPAQRAAEAQAVETVQDTADVILVPFGKLLHGATPVWLKNENGLTPSLYQQGLRFSLFGRRPGRSGKPLLSSLS
jgi:hypothetical protein